MATKFENRTTTVNAVIIDFEDMTKTRPVVVQVGYTRTLATAQKLVAEAMHVDVNRVAVRELVQSEFHAQNLTSGQLVNISTEYGLAEPTKEVPEGFTCVPYTAYQYIGFAFGYVLEATPDETDPEAFELNLYKPVAFKLDEERLEKYGKNDARGMLAHEAKNQFGMEVVYLDYKERHEVKRYAVVDSAEYQKLRYQG